MESSCELPSSFAWTLSSHTRRAIRQRDQWLDKHRIRPRIVAGIDDSALMKAFGQDGAGIFIAPAAIEAEVERQYQVTENKTHRNASDQSENPASIQRKLTAPARICSQICLAA